jgi:transcriptional regulator of arginine metabolism
MKARRHFTILDIVAGQRVGTQEELCKLLHQHGYNVTQATVSRDIKELQLAKTADGSGYRYALPELRLKNPFERMQRIFKETVLSCDHSENIIVIKTVTAAAQSVAAVIDAYDNPDILGTVAGDDTIIVVIKSKAAVSAVMSVFTDLINS